jgi:hypothetical protein
MGRQKGHPGPVKPEEEKQNRIIRFGMTNGDGEMLDKRIGQLNFGALKKVTISSYFRTLMVKDIANNSNQ